MTPNLAAFGIKFQLPVQFSGFAFPTFVGPFSTMDARISRSETVFDFNSIRRYQASKVGVSAARSDAKSANGPLKKHAPFGQRNQNGTSAFRFGIRRLWLQRHELRQLGPHPRSNAS